MNHARVLGCIAREPAIQQRYVARQTGLTERAVSMIVADLSQAGYLTKHRRGTRIFYEVHTELPLRGVDGEEPEVGALLALLDERGERQDAQAA